MEKQKQITWKQFESRTRKGIYDRLLIGLRINSKAWMIELYGKQAGDEMAQVFILGAGNVAFTHLLKGAPVIYGNKLACKRAQELTEWYASQAGLPIEWIESLPTSESQRTSGRAVTDFESACAAAELFQPKAGIELGI